MSRLGVVLAALLWAGAAWATPSVSGVSGTLTHGSTLTVSGTSLGTKGVAAPLKYDDFESGTVDSALTGWSHPAGWAKPTYSSGQLRTNSNKSAECFYDWRSCGDFDYSRNFGVSGDPGDISPISGLILHKAYIDVWYYLVPSSPLSRNHKIIRLHSNTGGAGNPNTYLNVYCTDGLFWAYDGSGSLSDQWAAGPPAGGVNYLKDKWSHLRLFVRESTANTENRDGDGYLFVDSTLVVNKMNNWCTRPDTSHYWSAWMGNYMAHDLYTPCDSTGATNCSGAWQNGDAYTYWDNAYIDTTFAHVEIGNASTYRACTETEIQIPSAWSSTSITLTANRGAFSTLEGKYLYVVDETGAVSAGYLLTSGGVTICNPMAKKEED